MPRLQSAYRRGHSTESALLRVISDVLDAADVGLVSLIGLLDLSAAFDTVDHDILIRRLQTSYGVTGRALEWIRSFLSERTQAVTLRGVTSVEARLTCSVPQGSALGPLLFILYTADVLSIAHGRGLNVHSYADDTQLYVSCSAGDASSSSTQLLECIEEIDQWMSSNRLKLNGDKTQFIWLGTRQQLAKVDRRPLMVGGVQIAPLDMVRNLGVLLDDE